MGSKTPFYADIMAFNSEVTGSCTLCNVRFPDNYSVRFIVDCGLYQEKDNENLNKRLEFKPELIDFAIATHTHVDHIGRFPLLVKKGYRGPIGTTVDATKGLMRAALKDCQGVLKLNSMVRGVAPLYKDEDVDKTMQLVQGISFGSEWWPDERICVKLRKNKHAVGAATVLVRAVYEGYPPITLKFTGDYNDINSFLDDSPKEDEDKDEMISALAIESTYGITESTDIKPRFKERMAKVIEEKNDMLLLAYSFGRTQEILYRLKCMQEDGTLSKSVTIYLDGKLGQKYTLMFPKLQIKPSMRDFLPDNLVFVGREQRENIISSAEKKIVITSSGTGSYGPAQYYLPYFLANPKAYVAFTGYTPENTLGRKLQTIELGETVKVGGVLVKRRAELEFFDEFSAHAKADTLIKYLNQFSNLKLVLINHGEPEKKFAFAKRVREEVNPKMVGILDRDYWFRVDPYGYVKSVPTKFL